MGQTRPDVMKGAGLETLLPLVIVNIFRVYHMEGADFEEGSSESKLCNKVGGFNPFYAVGEGGLHENDLYKTI